MKNCSYEKYFIDYISGELNQKEMLDFQGHLNNCSTCATELDKFYKIHYELKDTKRIELKQELLSEYHHNLSKEFALEKNEIRPKLVFYEWFQSIFLQRSWSVKLAEVLSLVILGIIGWFLFNPAEENSTSINANPEYFTRPISKAEVEYINYYFQAAELLLLELKNMDAQSGQNRSEIEFNKTIAQKLLIKTFIIHEIALRQNDPKILRFLSKMELLLYEVSNIPTNELGKSIETLNMIIDDSKLLDDARKFQKDFVRFQTSREKHELNSNQ
jgi:hypothetical protein